MAIKHGKCSGYHETMDEVYGCEGQMPAPSYVEPAMNRGSAQMGPQRKHPSDAQVNAILRMIDHNAIPEEFRSTIREYMGNNRMSFDGARNTISRMKQLISDDKVVEDGYYKDPKGTIWRVVESRHGVGRLYASYLNVLEDAVRAEDGTLISKAQTEWIYMPGAITALSKTWIMGPEDFKAYGDLYGECIKCHRELTKPESIERGMGQICANK